MLSAIRLARTRFRAGPTQRGLSLVELMVGITIGLIVVAGASLMAASQLSDNRRLLLETQVQQDLRAAADIVTREIRRSGYIVWGTTTLWAPDDPIAIPPTNNLSRVALNSGGEVVSYGYHRPGSNTSNTLYYGYSWASSSGVIRQRIGAGVPQDLTDRNSLLVTDFRVDLAPVATTQLACPQLCADGTQNCWPTVTLTDAVVTITGQPVVSGGETLRRTVTSRVRLRNNSVQFGAAATQVCP